MLKSKDIIESIVVKKRFTKYVLGGILTTLLVSISFLSLSLIPQSGKVHMQHALHTENGYKVGTIQVEDAYELPHRLSAGLNGGTDVYETSDTFLSQWIPADTPFHALGVSWSEEMSEETHAHIHVRTRKLNGQNSGWIEVHEDIDGDAIGVESETKYSFVRTAWSTHIQYKVEMETRSSDVTPMISNIEFTYIDSTEEPQEQHKAMTQEKQSEVITESEVQELTREDTEDIVAGLKITNTRNKLNVIPRNRWGANEQLRVFDGLGKPRQVEVSDEFKEKFGDEIALRREVKRDESNKLLIWPLQYPMEDIETIIVHHTASQEDAMEDSYAAMRAIYYYHTVTRGWGDIGYNYLIDEDGNVFEGRYGGDKVVGAHTAKFNVGSIGVAIIGNYEENEVQSGSVRGLVEILTELSEKYNLDPTEIATMRDENLHVISGHRDATHTTCPGAHLYEKLPAIRQLVKSELVQRGTYKGDASEIVTTNGVDFFDVDDRGIIVLGPEEVKTLTVRLRNTGTTTWKRGTSLVYRNGNGNVAGFDETVAQMTGAEVRPREIGTFDILMQGTALSGLKNYYLYLQVGNTLSERRVLLPVYVEPVNLGFELVRVDASPKLKLEKNQATKATFTLKNTGNVTWNPEQVDVISESTGSIFLDGHMLTQTPVQPGNHGMFEVMFKSENTSGRFEENLKLVFTDNKGNKVKSRSTQPFAFRVKGVKTTGEGAVLTATSGDQTMRPGERKRMWVEVLNDSENTWKRVGTDRVHVAFLKAPAIKVGNVLMEKAIVKPGESTKIYFEVTAPDKPGKNFINMILRHKTHRLSEKPLRFEFNVEGEVGEPRTNGRNNTPDTPAPVATTTQEPTVTTRTTPSPTRQASGNKVQQLGDNIRVALSFRGSPAIRSDSAIRIFDGNGKHLNDGKEIRPGEKIAISYSNGTYTAEFQGKKVTTQSHIRLGSKDGILTIDNYENRPAWNQSLNDNQYRGVLEVRAVDGELKVINELPLEHYLYGIGEVSNGDPTEKVKTIVILARTYAQFYIDREGTDEAKFPGKPYHIDDDPNVSQRYLGYGVEKRAPNVVTAVNGTRGKVVTYNNEIVKTPYFNTTDGTHTKSAEEVWGWTHTPYLVSVADPLCDATEFNGHGVGLSGCGATEAARRGYSFEEIIKYYYTGVEVADLY